MPLEGDRLLLNGASAGPFCGAVIVQGFPTEMYCVKGGATEYIHDWKFICGRMTRSERRAIDQQGETEAGASGDELGAPFFFGPLLSVYTYSHRQLLVAVWPTAIIRPLGAAPLGGLPRQYIPADAAGGLCIGRSHADRQGLGGLQSPTSGTGYIPVHCLLLLSWLKNEG